MTRLLQTSVEGEKENGCAGFPLGPRVRGDDGRFCTDPTGGEGTRPVGVLGTDVGLEYLIQEELRAFFLGVVEDLVGCA